MEFREYKVMYRRYASLFFIVGCGKDDKDVSRGERYFSLVERGETEGNHDTIHVE